MTTLVTGGAGYIGSCTVQALLERGEKVVVIDNLLTGYEAAVFPEAAFYETDIHDIVKVQEILETHEVDAVVHFAAFSQVGESCVDPSKYMQNNVGGTLCLLEAMNTCKVHKIVFSSTAAVYGIPQAVPIKEDFPTQPINPYGLTKRFMEQAMETFDTAYGLKSVCLRYFNAAGATDQRGEAHKPETHLIPLVLQVALGQRENIKIFGEDYDTPDGTCIRDYIHVEDLASAHLKALDYLREGGDSIKCNLGNGNGYSVKQVIDVCREVTGHKIPAIVAERRPGDPARLVATSSRAQSFLDWHPAKGDLKIIVEDAWRWHQSKPKGYLD